MGMYLSPEAFILLPGCQQCLFKILEVGPVGSAVLACSLCPGLQNSIMTSSSYSYSFLIIQIHVFFFTGYIQLYVA